MQVVHGLGCLLHQLQVVAQPLLNVSLLESLVKNHAISQFRDEKTLLVCLEGSDDLNDARVVDRSLTLVCVRHNLRLKSVQTCLLVIAVHFNSYFESKVVGGVDTGMGSFTNQMLQLEVCGLLDLQR